MPTTPPVSRRDFLAATGATTAAVAWTAQSYAKIIGANDRIRTAFIGAGGMGGAHLGAIKQLKEPDNVEAVAVADCWLTRAQKGASTVGAPQSMQDYRKLLDIKEID